MCFGDLNIFRSNTVHPFWLQGLFNKSVIYMRRSFCILLWVTDSQTFREVNMFLMFLIWQDFVFSVLEPVHAISGRADLRSSEATSFLT